MQSRGRIPMRRQANRSESVAVSRCTGTGEVRKRRAFGRRPAEGAREREGRGKRDQEGCFRTRSEMGMMRRSHAIPRVEGNSLSEVWEIPCRRDADYSPEEIDASGRKYSLIGDSTSRMMEGKGEER